VSEAAAKGSGKHVRLAAAGDLLLAAGGRSAPGAPHGEGALDGARELLAGADLAVGNLECTLPGDGATVPTEPRVVATPEMVRAVAAAGFRVVSLANNHMFDCLEAGFRRLRALLGELGVACFGAGEDLAEAAAPAIVEAGGLRLAFLGAVDERSGARQFAAPGRWGVAPLEMDRLTGQVRELAGEVDHVIVSPHWGEERLLIPSPQQVAQGRAMIEAGASLVLGHHPHVIQGLERRGRGAVAYSLGNFVARDVPYADGDVLRWNRLERTGCLLLAELTAEGLGEVRQVPTYHDGRRVGPEESGAGEQRIGRANRALARGVTIGRYRREHLWVKTLRPALEQLRWSRLRSLRLGKVRKALSGLWRSARAR